MKLKIFWTPLALESFYECVYFLDHKWWHIIVDKFISLTDQKLESLLTYPYLGEKTEYPDIRRVLIHQNVVLFYMPEKNSIKLLIFWDTRQNPNSLYQKLASS